MFQKEQKNAGALRVGLENHIGTFDREQNICGSGEKQGSMSGLSTCCYSAFSFGSRSKSFTSSRLTCRSAVVSQTTVLSPRTGVVSIPV